MEGKMLSAEGIGKNIEKAIENALLELKAPREDVDIKILNEGGLFKKAKVLVTISDDAKEKYIKKEEKKKASLEVKEEKKAEAKEKKQEEPKKEKKKEIEKEEQISVQKQEEEKEDYLYKDISPITFLKGFFEAAGKDVVINESEDDKFITYSVEGENLGELIGHRGECFFAISRLLTAVCGKSEKKILLDIGGFREKRAESLTALAKRVANKVAKSGRYAKLDPMNPSDRRIIHTALQDDQRVTTLSKGSEPYRYVIIFPKGEE